MWFVLGYYILHIGTILLLYKIGKQRSAFGISLDYQVCLLIAAFSRCIWFTDTQLPTLWIAIIEIVVAVALHSYLVY